MSDFIIDEDGKLTSYKGPLPGSGELVIPDGVIIIAAGVFRNFYGFTGLSLPDSLTTIEDNVFDGCYGLGYITLNSAPSTSANALPTSLTSIGVNAFKNCYGIDFELSFSSAMNIQNVAFEGCTNLKSISIGSAVTNIGLGAFFNCTGITTLTFVDNSTAFSTLGDYAFQNCSSLTSVTFPSTITDLGNGTFWGCTSLTSVIIYSALVTLRYALFLQCSSLASITIPSTVQNIGQGGGRTFEGCSSLTSVTIPQSITYISTGSFAFCTSLTTVTFSGTSTLTSIGDSTFSICNNLTTITLPSTLTSIGNYAFHRCSSLTSITIPSGLTTLGSAAFAYSGLTSITIPAGIETISSQVFQECPNLSSITLSEGITSIGDYSFYGCTSLSSISFPSTLITIGNGSFASCTGLTTVTLPFTLTTVRDGAFRSCTNADITWTYKTGTFSGSPLSFYDVKSFTLIFDASVSSIPSNKFSGATWIAGSIALPFTITTIGANAFLNCSNADITWTYKTGTFTADATSFTGVKSFALTFDPTVTSISNSAFSGATWLKGSLVFPSTVTSIGDNVFNGCTGITTVTLPFTLTTVGTNAFEGCTNADITWIYKTGTFTAAITSFFSVKSFTLTFDSTVQSITAGAFQDSYWLVGSVIIPSTVTSIGDNAFNNCIYLYSVTIPNSITSIGVGVFKNCEKLGSPSIPSTVTSIGDNAFEGCVSLINFSIPYTVTSIGSNAFAKCVLTDITWTYKTGIFTGDITSFSTAKSFTLGFDPSITNISANAFENEKWLKGKLIIPTTVDNIGASAFSGCTGLTSVQITVGGSGITIENNAFYGCEYANINLNYISGVVNVANNTCFSLVPSVTLSIDSTCTTISTNAFSGASWLTSGSISIPNSVISIGSAAFKNCSNSDFTWTYKSGTAQSDTFTGARSFTLKFDSECTSISNNAFLQAIWLVGSLDFSLATNLTSIGDNAFNNCTGLTGNLTLPDSITSIGASAFLNCSVMTGELKLPGKITSISNAVFKNCGFTGSLYIPGSVINIGANAFEECQGFTGNLYIPNSVISIGDYAFSDLPGMTGTLTLSNNLTTIGKYVFASSIGFTGTLTIPSKVTSIGDSAFSDCRALTGSLTIPTSVTSISQQAFMGCTGFNGTLLLPWTTTIGTDAFTGTNFTSTQRYSVSLTTGSVQNVIVPSGMSSVTAYVLGGDGFGCPPILLHNFGYSAYIKGTFDVTSGDNLKLYVAGSSYISQTSTSAQPYTLEVGGGGGSSAIVDSSNKIVIIAGGSGGGDSAYSYSLPGGSANSDPVILDGETATNVNGSEGGQGGTGKSQPFVGTINGGHGGWGYSGGGGGSAAYEVDGGGNTAGDGGLGGGLAGPGYGDLKTSPGGGGGYRGGVSGHISRTSDDRTRSDGGTNAVDTRVTNVSNTVGAHNFKKDILDLGITLPDLQLPLLKKYGQPSSNGCIVLVGAV